MKKPEKKQVQKTSKGISKLIAIILVVTILTGIGFIVRMEIIKNQYIGAFDIYLHNKDIYAIAFDGDRIWAGGANGLFLLTPIQDDTGKPVRYRTEEIGHYRFVKALLTDNGRLWVGNDHGLTLIEEDVLKHQWTEKDGLPDKRVNAIFMDSTGILWVGTWGGAVTFDGLNLRQTYTMEDGLLENMVNTIFEDSLGGMWFGSYVAPQGGISVLMNNKWTYFSAKNGLLHSNINVIIELNNGDILAGGGLYTKGGATQFTRTGTDLDISGYLLEEDGIAGAKVRSLMQDSQMRVWVGSEYDGLTIFNSYDESRNPVILTTKKGLSNNEVKVIAEASDLSIWIGTMKGLVKINKGGIENVR